MTWKGDRKATLPRDWTLRRQMRLDMDGHRCTWTMPDGTRCGRDANQVDHIGDKSDHRMENLRSLCEWHNDRRTSAQGNAARKRVTQRRPCEKHPGLID